jgi:hypothetical protein
MPTYSYRCDNCGQLAECIQGIKAYSEKPLVPECMYCQTVMTRYFAVPDGGLNPLAGDRHYDGLQATDGADISTRSKHREYMKATGLTMADDFKNHWKEAKKQREAYYKGEHKDKALREHLAREVYRRIP